MKRFRRSRRQKIVLRSRLRRERWSRWSIALLKIAVLAALGGVAIYGQETIRQWVSMPNFFMVQSFRIEGPVAPIDKRIEARLQGLKGQRLWNVKPKRVEQNLLKEFPILKSARCRRGLTGKISVKYETRVPLALAYWVNREQPGKNPATLALQQDDIFHIAGATFLGYIDADGVLFAKEPFVQVYPPIEVVSFSRNNLGQAAQFLHRWLNAQKEKPFAECAVQHVYIDHWQEISLEFENPAATGHSVTIYWGRYHPAQFDEKWKRLSQVWMDLENKGTKVQSMDVREIPQHKNLTLENRQILGRVIVRPLKLVAEPAGQIKY